MFALWVSKLFEGAKPFELTSTHGRDKEGPRKFGVYNWATCVSCNTGWMSELEEQAAPLIRDAFFGKPVTWNVDEQLVVATWATKTALMIDRSNPAGHKVPLEHFDYLHKHRRPPDPTQLDVGFYRPEEGEPHRGVTAGVGKGPDTHRGSYRIAYSIGQLVFVFHGYAGPASSQFHVQSFGLHASKLLIPMWNTLATIWPRTGPDFQFPPPNGFALNNTSLDTPLMGGVAALARATGTAGRLPGARGKTHAGTRS